MARSMSCIPRPPDLDAPILPNEQTLSALGCVLVWLAVVTAVRANIVKRSYSDQSVRGYLTEVGVSV